MRLLNAIVLLLLLVGLSCKSSQPGELPESFFYRSVTNSGQPVLGLNVRDAAVDPVITITFSVPLDQKSVANAVQLSQKLASQTLPLVITFPNDTTLRITPQTALSALTAYILTIRPTLSSQRGTALNATLTINLITAVDSTDKFPRISDDALLDLVQKQTVNYFYDFGHPVSGMARERSSSGDLVTTGGTGFGIMAMVVAVDRKFISRQNGLARVSKIANFLTANAIRYHGAFPHWLNGATGATIPFSPQDNGGDLVETSLLMQGLLTARQYFDSPTNAGEIVLRSTINDLWNGVQWDWYTKNGTIQPGTETNLYWHWSPNFTWAINLPVRGWNEALITHVLGASSTTFPVPKPVYDVGWAQNGSMKNGNNYYDINLPLGPAYGGPLFFSHYSFLGINPRNLTDAYADYGQQNTAHTLINYTYCQTNPKQFGGYGPGVWGLTASDEQNGYSTHSPTNDNGTISPTAALSAMPYAPTESMQALRYFYYKLGDKIWKQYGFVDAFNLNDLWFSDQFLAIDQGPIIVMIENQRSGLLWRLFMSCPEVKTGMTRLGFRSPNL